MYLPKTNIKSQESPMSVPVQHPMYIDGRLLPGVETHGLMW